MGNYNIYRRKLTKFLFNSKTETDLINIENLTSKSVKKILIIRPNHRLGNQLLISPLIQEIETIFPNCKIDLFTKGFLAPILYQNYDSIHHYHLLPKDAFKKLGAYITCWFRLLTKKYDLVINAVGGSSSGTLATKWSRSKNRVFLKTDFGINNNPEFQHMGKKPVVYLRTLLQKNGFKINNSAIPSMDLKLSTSEIEEGKKVLESITNNNKPTICIFTYATGAKCLSEDWWNPFYKELNNQFKDYNIIEMLPKENISMINFSCPNYYSNDIRLISAIMANCAIFIGADSGMMHLANASNIPILGLFSRTNIDTYGPYGNNSISFNPLQTSNTVLLNEVDKIINHH